MKYLKKFENHNYLLAPNGEESKLPPHLWKLVRTQDFTNWFGKWQNWQGKSKHNIQKNGDPIIHNLDFNWEPKIFYHGTNRKFEDFSNQFFRTFRNELFQGDGFFFTTSEIVAWRYAHSAMNQVLLKDYFFDALRKNYPQFVIELVESIYSYGYEKGWNMLEKKYGFSEFSKLLRNWESETGLDINTLCNFVENVEGANIEPDEDSHTIFSLFSNSNSHTLSDWFFENADEYFFKNALPEFNVVEAFLKLEKYIKTDKKEVAQKAKENGYDSVIFDGPDTVNGQIEYIIYDPKNIKIIKPY